MSTAPFDDETLMAFADGELDETTTQRIEAALQTDDALMMRVALFLETRDAARDALALRLQDPVPDALVRSVRSLIDASQQETLDNRQATAEVLTFRPRETPATKPSLARRLLPLAASVAIVAAGTGGYLAGRAGGPGADGQVAGGMRFAELPAGSLTQALDSLAAGAQATLGAGEGALRVIATFRAADNAFCREFEVKQPDDTLVTSIACRKGGEWSMRLATVTAAPQGTYTPASPDETLEAYLASMGAGPALTAEEEAKALQNPD